MARTKGRRVGRKVHRKTQKPRGKTARKDGRKVNKKSRKNGRKVMRGGEDVFVNYKDVMDNAKGYVDKDEAIVDKDAAKKLIDDLQVNKQAILDAIAHMENDLNTKVDNDLKNADTNVPTQMLFDDHVKKHIEEGIADSAIDSYTMTLNDDDSDISNANLTTDELNDEL